VLQQTLAKCRVLCPVYPFVDARVRRPLYPSPPAARSSWSPLHFLTVPAHRSWLRRLLPPPASQASPTFLTLLKAATLRLWPIISRWTQRSHARETACNLPLVLLLNCSAAVVVFVLPRVCHRVCSGFTPLHFSAGEGNVDACDILLKSGADVNAKNNE